MQQDSTDPTGVSVTRKGQGGPPATAIRARERKANAALQMKMAGADWSDIAEVLGFPTARQAMVAVERSLEKGLKTESSQAMMRAMAGKRLERLLRSCWPKAIDPENPEHLIALTKAREIIDRHAKLYGLDAPTEVVVHSPSVRELEQWVAKVTASQLPQVEEYDIFEGEIVEDGDEGEGGVPALVGA